MAISPAEGSHSWIELGVHVDLILSALGRATQYPFSSRKKVSQIDYYQGAAALLGDLWV